MGGTSYIIKGELDQSRLDPAPRRKTLVDRLLRRQQYDTPTYTEFGKSTLITVPPGTLPKQLSREFKQFLGRRIPAPWEATKTFLRYLDAGIEVYLRGEKSDEKDEADWYVQFCLRGAAGMAETSAELGYHWADIWLRTEIHNISESILKPEGFTASCEFGPTGDPILFIPVGNSNYGVYAAFSLYNDKWECQIDESVVVAHDDCGESLRGEIEKVFGELMADGQCRCQLCAPEYMPEQTITL